MENLFSNLKLKIEKNPIYIFLLLIANIKDIIVLIKDFLKIKMDISLEHKILY